jgi:CHASE3 domain sensor protein
MKYSIIACSLLLSFAACQNQTKNKSQTSDLLTDSLNRSSSPQDTDKTVKVTKEFFDALSKNQHESAQQCMDTQQGNSMMMRLSDSLKNYPNFKLDVKRNSREGAAAGSVYRTIDAVISSGQKKMNTQITLRKSSMDTMKVWKVYDIKYQ